MRTVEEVVHRGQPTLLLAYVGVRAHCTFNRGSRDWRLDRLRVRKTEALFLKVWKGGCIVGTRSVASAPNRIAACGKTQTSPILIGSPAVVKHRRVDTAGWEHAFATFRTSTVTASWRGCLRFAWFTGRA